MKMFKKSIKCLFYSLLMIAGFALTGCSTPASDKTDNGLSHENGGSINHDDGDAIAYFLCEEMCGSYVETAKLCFYANKKVALRVTSLSDNDLYGKRFDKIRGTYTGDPTKDGDLVIDFEEEGHETIGTEKEDYTSMEEALADIHIYIKYGKYNGEPDIPVTIKDGELKFSSGNYSWYSFVRTDSKDLGPYNYDGVSRRQNDNKRTEWTIPEGYTSVGASCFSRGAYSSEKDYYKHLKTIKLPSTIKKISNSAFYNCTGLETINIPTSCTIIDSNAFYNCTSLKEIDIPKNIEKIGNRAFGKDSSSSSSEENTIVSELVIRFADGITTIPENIFSGQGKNTIVKKIIIPSSVKTIGKKAFYDFYPSETIVIPEGVEEIEEEAFACDYYSSYSDSDIIGEEIKLPATLKKIGNKAFYYKQISKLLIPEGVEEIGESAFASYRYADKTVTLEQLVIPSTLKRIENELFAYRPISKVEIPEGVEEIGSKAFYSATVYNQDKNITLEEINLPATLKKMESDSINISNIKKIIFNGNLYGLNDILKAWNFTNSYGIKIYCGDVEVSTFFKAQSNSSFYYNMWENDEITLIFKSDKSYRLKKGTSVEKGVWFTEESESSYSSDKETVTLYTEDAKLRNFDYEFSDGKLFLTDSENASNIISLNKVTSYSVIEQKKSVSEKWSENAEQDSDGNYIYYHYYISKFKPGYYEYLDLPVYYEDSNYKYENRYYKSCKAEIEDILNNGYRYSTNYEYDENDNRFKYLYLYNDPQTSDN